jgi:hypothetical protein
MSLQISRSIKLAALILAVSVHTAGAQPGGRLSGTDIQFNSGQTIQPIFDGWTKNADGSYELHFGYLNRNYVEEVAVPVGVDNTVEPDGPDRGQPTYFYTRFNKRVFSVRVPANFGKREIVWTLKVRGKAERAVGWLQPEWEIEPSGGDSAKNKPPAITVTSPGTVTLPAKLTLTARVTDDGLPLPGKGRVGGNSENPPAFRFPESTPTAPTNLPQLYPPRPRISGLSVSWLVWRGPAGAVFEPVAVAVKDGQAVTAVTFSKPGEYILRAIANDSSAQTRQEVKVVVSGNAP